MHGPGAVKSVRIQVYKSQASIITVGKNYTCATCMTGGKWLRVGVALQDPGAYSVLAHHQSLEAIKY